MDYEILKSHRNKGFTKEVGFVTTEIREGYARGELTIQEKHMNPVGSVHGGVLLTIADNLGGTAATSRGRFVTTLSANIQYLRPAIDSKKLYGETTEVKLGKNISVYEVMITDDAGREIAKATLDYCYLGEVDF